MFDFVLVEKERKECCIFTIGMFEPRRVNDATCPSIDLKHLLLDVGSGRRDALTDYHVLTPCRTIDEAGLASAGSSHDAVNLSVAASKCGKVITCMMNSAF